MVFFLWIDRTPDRENYFYFFFFIVVIVIIAIVIVAIVIVIIVVVVVALALPCPCLLSGRTNAVSSSRCSAFAMEKWEGKTVGRRRMFRGEGEGGGRGRRRMGGGTRREGGRNSRKSVTWSAVPYAPLLVS